MTKPWVACGAIALGVLLAQVSGGAHHPIAPQYDTERELTLRGTVESFEWTSPHSTLRLLAREGAEERRWTIELDGESALESLGWKEDTLGEGQQVTVQAWQARDGSARAVGWAVQLEDGRELAAINPHDPSYAEYTQRQQSSAGERADTAGEVTLVGCVAFEEDYRQRTDGQRAAIEPDAVPEPVFVLVDARPAPSELAAADPVGTAGDREREAPATTARGDAAADGATTGAVGTSGETEPRVYSLTGGQEGEFARVVGRQVHVIGTVEQADDDRAGRDLPRVTVTAWHPVNDFCPAQPPMDR